ncbi:hypothetical protein CEE37_04960 [candidate division LCP-89 bacterium B3_LCP]|uniref:Secretion system C-terminal sorting domain-containing protein n=1 Tax=candidate division LCP-89 bacterium B3_LCP TaxID=2012998 RepID=A0A532V201_UNCL8|nr:MAG: hypothetical protein CEE37_04960 [candidate division LCP-89 bacterium B3_LCP]
MDEKLFALNMIAGARMLPGTEVKLKRRKKMLTVTNPSKKLNSFVSPIQKIRRITMKSWITGIIILAMAFITTASIVMRDSDPYQEWVKRFGSTGDDEGIAIALDSYGNIYVGGYTQSAGVNGMDYIITKYDISGNELWSVIIENEGDDLPRGMVVYGDAVYMTGEGHDNSSWLEYYTVKVNAVTGDVEWDEFYRINENDFKAFGIAANSHGVYVTGEGWTNALASEADIHTVKYNHSGNYLWARTYDHHPSVANNDFAVAICVDGTGIYICGGVFRLSTMSTDFFVFKYTHDGDEAWPEPYFHNGPGPANSMDFAWDFEVAGNHLYVTGERGGFLFKQEYWTVKLNKNNGSEIWGTPCPGPDDHIAQALSVFAGETYVTGRGSDGSDWDYVTVKYDANGNQVWVRNYDYAGGDDKGNDIVVNDYGVFVTGESEATPSGNLDYATVAYEHADGADLWDTIDRRYGPVGNHPDRANAIAVDTWNVYITGGSKISNTNGMDIATIRYNHGPWVDLPNMIYVVPAEGDTLSYDITVSNRYDENITLFFWMEAMLPDGSVYGPFVGPVEFSIAPGDTITRLRELIIPPGAPPGIYKIYGRLGVPYIIPPTIFDEDYFTVQKMGVEPSAGNCWPVDTGTIVEIDGTIQVLPEGYSLWNHPNPFNPSTTLSFALPEASKVQLTVYDISGRVVAELVNGWRDAGIHDVTFDGSELASGMYIYRLKAGEYTACGKMMLMK